MSNLVPLVSVQEVLSLARDKGYLLIDVRRPEEFTGELGHIPGSQLVTLGPDLESFVKSLDRSEKIVFVCRSGIRSGQATEFALSIGFKDVFNMDGGMIQWNEVGLEVVR